MDRSKRIQSPQSQWQLILCMLAILSCNTIARPIHSSSKSCTVRATIDKVEGIATFGLQDYGKQITNVADASLSAYLTILPGNTFDELCKVNAEDYNLKYLKSLRFPPGRIAAMVDLDTGGCDDLTKASNALILQQYLTRDLKYILFYKSRGGSVKQIPTLDFDRTMPPTTSPTMLPTNNPTNDPTTRPTNAPSQSPTEAPTFSMQPSSRPSVSLAPTLSAAPTLSVAPSTLPSVVPTTAEPTTTGPTIVASTTPQSQTIIYVDPIEEETDAPAMLDTTTPTSTIESVRLQKTSHLQNQNPWTYEITNIFDSAREKQKKELEENDSVVFLTLSMGDAHSIVAELYRAENWENGKIPLFSIPGNENWDMKLYFSTEDVSPTCGESYPTPTDSGRIPLPSFVTSKPTQAPILLHGGSANESQPYQDNAPGTFAIFKFIFFALLIASPCLRLAHQWWAGGGRIRLRRSEENSNRVVGLQYIPPMDNWFGSPLGHSDEAPRPPERLTYQQIMSLPEIQYTKPIHTDEKLSKRVHTIEEEDGESEDDEIDNRDHKITERNDQITPTNTSETESELSEASFENEPSIRLDHTSPRQTASSHNDVPLPASSSTATSEPSNPVSIEPESDRDDSIVSEASFENEPSVRLDLPTSPLRVSSRSLTQTSNPISPRAIVVTEEVLPADEETPEEQPLQEQQHQQQQPSNLQQPMLLHSPLPASTQQQDEQSLHSPQPQQTGTLSFRTQRRLQNFTTTTCTCCSICIDEFEEGETIRLLPRCGHAFHTSCILPWLQDRQGCCPLCKMEVLDRSMDSDRDRSMDSDRAILGEDVSRRAEF